MPGVVRVPVARGDPALRGHVLEQRGTGVRRQDVERGRGDPALNSPVDRSGEHVRILAVQTEDEASIDQDAEVIEPPDDVAIVAAQVLPLAGAGQAAGRERLESDEEAPESRRRRVFDDVIAQDGIDGRGPLEHTPHSPHAAEQIPREARIAQEMVVEEIEVAARESGDLGKRRVDGLGVERAPAREEPVLVAERTVVRTPP